MAIDQTHPPAPPGSRAGAANPGLWAGSLLGLAVLVTTAVQAVRVVLADRRAGTLTAQARRIEQRPPAPRMRVLLVGDSTGLGVGAAAGQSLGERLAADWPDAEVLNTCRIGACIGEVTEQLSTLHLREPVDLLLLLAGGNDVMRGVSHARMGENATALLRQLLPLARRVVWLGPCNIGLTPIFVPPFSWWMSRRTEQACEVFQRSADQAGVQFVNFCHKREEDLFSAQPERYFAADWVHPTGETYGHAYEVLKARLAHGADVLGIPPVEAAQAAVVEEVVATAVAVVADGEVDEIRMPPRRRRRVSKKRGSDALAMPAAAVSMRAAPSGP